MKENAHVDTRASRAQPLACRPKVDGRSIEVGSRSQDLKARTDAVVAIAAENVGSVDRDARFPEEAITAARGAELAGSCRIPSSLCPGRSDASATT